MQRKILRFVLLFFIIACFLLSSITLSAKENNEKRIIKVGFPIQEGLSEIDAQGNYSGYTYEYLQEIAQYANWEYEFVLIDKDINESLTEMMTMLEKGEIDILGGMVYSEGLAEKYDYAGRSYGNANTVLKVLYDSDITNLNSAARTQLKVAVIEGSTQRQKELDEFCALYKIKPVLVECADREGQMKALEAGEAEAMLDVSAVPTAELRTVASFAPRPFYFTTTKGKSDIINELNSSIDLIEQTDPYYTANLYNKYFGGNNSMFMLTSAETQFIENSKPIKIGVLLGMPPFQNVDSDGKLSGITIDMLDYISKKSGLTFEYVKAKTQKELDEMISNNEVDVVSFVLSDYDATRNENVALTRSYMQSQNYVVMKKGKEQSYLKDKIYASYPVQLPFAIEGKTIETDSLQEALDLIAKGKAEYTYADGYIMQYYVNQSDYNDLVLLPSSSEDFDIGFGIVRPIDKDLLSIFNKVIINIADNELQNIIYPNTTYNREFSIQEWIRINPFKALAIITTILFIIIVLLVRGLRNRKRMNDKVSMDLEKRRQIYELSNDYFFEYNEEDQTLMLSLNEKGEASPIIYYLDKFHLTDYDKVKIDSIEKFVSVIKSLPEGTVEVEALKQDGCKNWISLTGKKIYDKDGKRAYIIGKIKNIDKEKKKEKNLIKKAESDSLTHVYNAQTCRNKIEESLKTIKDGQKGAFLLIDADNFKGVNDSFGHLTGDKTLIFIGKLLLEEVGANGICGRLGGDEFVLYKEDIQGKDELIALCERIKEKARQHQFDDEHNLTLSMGAVLFDSQQDYNYLYEKSDKALYQVKESGRNNYLILE